MAFDGITIAAITSELRKTLLNTRINKIAQPETDELILTIKGNSSQYRLLLSSDASLPLVYITNNNQPSPMTAPTFCMVLRKYLQNARIVDIYQPEMERIIVFELEHLDELGDLRRKKLLIEIMGKHSNIIFLDEEDTIIDSIKRVNALVSSVREVLPGRKYFITKTQEKVNPLYLQKEDFINLLTARSCECYKALYQMMTGLSPVIAEEICYRAGVDGNRITNSLMETEKDKLYDTLKELMKDVQEGNFSAAVYYENGTPKEYGAVKLTIFNDLISKEFNTISELLENYYAEKNIVTRIRQRSVDLRRIVSKTLERDIKKYDLQKRQLEDAAKREKYKVYGELLHVYGYSVEAGAKEMEALDYYTNTMIKVPLDPTLTTAKNAKRYFDKYTKMKRTAEALTTLLDETKNEIDHLESIMTSLDIALREEDLVQIKQELVESGYIHAKGKGKKEKVQSKPFKFVSSDGYEILVGKNNFQNDELTFKTATGNDWWFHAKGIPGSHVVVINRNVDKATNIELPDATYREAAALAAYYSKARGQDKVEIDYTLKKNVKKPNGAKPGFVVYYTNYSMIAQAEIAEKMIH